MSVSVGSKIRQMAADGYFGKRDLEKAANDMLDGRGITHREKRAFVKGFTEALSNPDVYVTDTAKRAFDRLESRMGHYSQSKEAYAPTLDKAEIKDILSDFKEGAPVYSGAESPVMTRMGGRAKPQGAARDIGANPPAPPPPRRYYGGGE
jgi:hypothetical protein